MFGYVVVNQSELKFREFDVYHSYYCGLCENLKERYGRTGQMSLNYDMTFVLMLLSSLYEPEETESEQRCAAHPFKKHQSRTNSITDYISDMTILFSRYKAKDNWQDERKLSGLVYGNMLERKERKHPSAYTGKVEKINRLMSEYYEAEKAGTGDIDTMSQLFGRIMAEITAYKDDEWKESLERLGFFLGKFIYMLDAYEDIEDDIKSGSFNPLKEKYKEPGFEEEYRTVLTLTISQCCMEFEQLPVLDNAEILRNILYSGVWTRYNEVLQKREKALAKTNNAEK